MSLSRAGDTVAVAVSLSGPIGAGKSTLVNTLAGEFTAPIEAKEGWSDLRVPFSALVATKPGRGDAPAWRGDDLVQVGVVVQRDAGASAWGEIDNLGFY